MFGQLLMAWEEKSREMSSLAQKEETENLCFFDFIVCKREKSRSEGGSEEMYLSLYGWNKRKL